MKSLNSNSVIHKNGVQMHLKLKAGDVSRYVLTPGDPGRIPIIGKTWEEYHEIQYSREYRSASGKYKGINISACSTGIGGPSTDIAVVELVNVGADTFIRVGTCAAIQKNIEIGDIIINTGALRLTGTTDAYVGKEYPAVANYEIVLALIEAAEKLNYKYHLGLTASVDSFYAGEVYPIPNNFWNSKMENVINDLDVAKVACFEMEAATLFVLANILGLRAGSVCIAGTNRKRERSSMKVDIEKVCHLGNEAIKVLAEWDKEKERHGKKYYYPSIMRNL